MEVAIANSTTTAARAANNNAAISGLRSPFQREVREWQRIDPATGALLTGRLEADRWINGPSDSYGKISDSQNIAQPDGTQLSQRKQLEVLQARTASGAVQVIRAQTVQTTSSRWSSSATSSPVTTANGSRYNSNSGSPFNNGLANGYHYNNKYHRLAPRVDVDSDEVVDDDDDDDDGVVVVAPADADDYADDDIEERRHNNTKSHTSISNGNSYSNGLSSSLLLDTAPSLKLSNLMKSNSSVSSNSSSSTATGTIMNNNNNSNNIHKHPHSNINSSNSGRVSLHSIAGNVATTIAAPASSLSTSSLSASTATATSTSSAPMWRTQQQQQQQQRSSRLFEPLPTFGKDNSGHGGSLSKPRVGGSSRGFAFGNVANDDDDDVGFGDAARAATAVVVADERCSLHLTPTQLHRQPRRDLESFRHYNDHPTGGINNHNNNSLDDDDNDGDALRLSARHQRRQQIPSSSSTLLQRGRSISTDDLSTEWDPRGEEAAVQDEPGEWRRVSKLRRSFQSATRSGPSAPRRPLDLPESSVSVSRIRAELENGRRLTTAMRNNHVDLAALQTILDAPGDDNNGRKPAPAQRSTFLTAESLKEIRGRLKKLSDESLYKEDFVVHHPDQIEVRPRPLPQLRQLSPEQQSPTSTPRSAFRVVGQPRLPATPSAHQSAKHTTHSLESRQRSRDTSSAEWHLRRKSYGFEKMAPPDDPASPLLRMDASTDSGLGRSGELAAWSPTEAGPSSSSASARGTVIHFGGGPQRRQPRASSDADDSGDETRPRPATTQVRLNGLREDSDSPPHGGAASTSTTTAMSQLLQRTQQKRVEFCKTEVHFAAESGRVNIVETDGKPPPTNNFRRRRRTASGPLQSLVKGASTAAGPTPSVALPVTRFADDRPRPRTVATHTVAYKASLVERAGVELVEPSSVTVSVPNVKEPLAEGWRGSYTSTSGVESTDGENDEIAAIRGILKNKPVKPKPYHLGDNFDSADALWGVQLKPVDAGPPSPLQSRRESFDTGPKVNAAPTRSVAERVRIVEKRQDSGTTNGYSTKINLNLGESTPDWTQPELPKSNVMNIELYSPHATLEKPASAAAKANQGPPEAKPRTTVPSSDSSKGPLKIIREARGARRLREHELSFFGVQVGEPTPQQISTAATTSKRTLPHRHRAVVGAPRGDHGTPEPRTHETTTTKWNLLNDKPDLLRHSPVLVEPQVVTRTAQITTSDHRSDAVSEAKTKKSFSPVKRVQYSDEEADRDQAEGAEDGDEDHLYENITNEISSVIKVVQPPPSYDRKTDLERDERILSEMTHNADQTMKAISDEAALKDQRWRSLARRNSKPLETIDEKVSDTCIAVKVVRSVAAAAEATTVASRARSSSQSSVESCPRARSRSLSSEREYENVKVKASRPPSAATKSKHSKPVAASRSSSRESQRSAHTGQGSSEDELGWREARSLRTKTKRVASSSSQQEKRRRDTERREAHSRSLRTASTTATSSSSQHKERSKSGSTTRSSQRERAECPTTDHHGSSSRRHKSDSLDAHKRAGSDRRTVPSSEKHEASRSETRLVRSSRSAHHDHESSQRSSNRSERSGTEKDREKEKTSKSKGHSRASPAHHVSDAHHQHKRPSHSSGIATAASAQASVKGCVPGSGEHRKTSSSAAATRESHSTYVCEMNLANTQTAHSETTHTPETTTAELADTHTNIATAPSKDSTSTPNAQRAPLLPPPRKKRLKSLIPIPATTPPSPLPAHPTDPPIPVHTPGSSASGSVYEHQTKSKLIPPSYSNQSTLRKTASLQHSCSNLAQARKPSLKYTQSTASSFAFLPAAYMPTKRNSDVSHIYDNYLLYATPAAAVGGAKPERPYQQTLVNDHAELFGGPARITRVPKPKSVPRYRTTRSRVSTHYPFGICTCS